MDHSRHGILDNVLAPLGTNLVDPGGQVSGMMGDAESLEEKRRRELAAAQEMARQRSLMEAAAAQPQVEQRQLSSWNPFVLLFGQPGESNAGLIGK